MKNYKHYTLLVLAYVAAVGCKNLAIQPLNMKHAGNTSLKGGMDVKGDQDEQKGNEVDEITDGLAKVSLDSKNENELNTAQHSCIRIDFSNPGIAPGRVQAFSLEYSDSEEEDAPHYEWVYNHTKIKDLRLEGGKFIQNHIASLAEVTPDQLQKDAKEIWKKASSQDKTTVLCVALQNKDGRIKKFVFTSLINYNYNQGQEDKMILEAHQRGYHVVQAQQSHAEGALFQFLQERPTTYTGIMGIGCDKPFCKNCLTLLEVFLGKKYRESSITVVEAGKSFTNNWYTPPAFEAVLQRKGLPPQEDAKCQRRIWQNQHFKYHPQSAGYWESWGYNYGVLDEATWRNRRGKGVHRAREIIKKISEGSVSMSIYEIQQTTGASYKNIVELIKEEDVEEITKYISGQEPKEVIVDLLAWMNISNEQFEALAQKNNIQDQDKDKLLKAMLNRMIEQKRKGGTWFSGSGYAIDVELKKKGYPEKLVNELIEGQSSIEVQRNKSQ